MYEKVNTVKGAAVNYFLRWPFPGRGPFFANHYPLTLILLRSLKPNNVTYFAHGASQKRFYSYVLLRS